MKTSLMNVFQITPYHTFIMFSPYLNLHIMSVLSLQNLTIMHSNTCLCT